ERGAHLVQGRVGEDLDAHVEAVGVAALELAALDDVAAGLDDRSGDRVHDAGAVLAHEGHHVAAGGGGGGVSGRHGWSVGERRGECGARVRHGERHQVDGLVSAPTGTGGASMAAAGRRLDRGSLGGVLAVLVTSVLWGTTGTAATFAPEVGPLAIGA